MVINAVDRTLDILILLYEEGKEMGVSEIAEKLDIYKSTVFRSLYTLEAKGFVKQNPLTEKYWLGMKLYAIGMSMNDKISLKKIIKPYTKVLQQEFSEVVNVAVLDMTRPDQPMSIIIEKEIGDDQMIIVNPPKGSSSTCFGSSVGKCLLAFSDIDLSKLMVTKLIKYTENTITDFNKFLENLEEIKEKGYAVDNEELEIGLTCVGAPILDKNNKAVAAISLSGPTQRMRSWDFDYLIKRVVEVSKAISEEFQ